MVLVPADPRSKKDGQPAKQILLESLRRLHCQETARPLQETTWGPPSCGLEVQGGPYCGRGNGQLQGACLERNM